MYSFSYLEPVCCSMSSSNCCFQTCIQVFQEADQVVWYSHLLKNFPQFIVIHTVRGFGIVNKMSYLCLNLFHPPLFFSGSVVSDSLWPHGLQHARLSCPSLSPRVWSNSCPLSQWCYPTISSSVTLFSSCPQSCPASGLFQWVCSSHYMAKVLEFQLQHQSFQRIFRVDFL